MDKQTALKIGFLAGAAVISLASTTAGATAVCNGSGTSVAVASGTNFIKAGFTQQCSANVVMDYTQDATQVGVCAGSNKGNIKYGGSTAGGAVASSGSWTSAATISSTTTGC
ncbi:hypothetical protein LIN78_11050 [Leeia sp. TBRC 13508]|uniref:Uncharacterized protein n=1 Tax=Leeia speluncae TaxID=2884804 RepID=A0ABS8D8X6_9NEIS|nr:hypothetical protein [Leeia speluncae]MCB6184083.1 hypothetical protein [Leeia speluncae]